MGTFKIFDDVVNSTSSNEGMNIAYQLNKRNKQFSKDIREQIKLIVQKNICLDDGRIIKQGNIIFRPLEKNENISKRGFNHYAIVLGTTAKGEKLIVDIDNKRNVRISLFEDFKLKKFTLNKIMEEKNDIDFNLIAARIIEMQYELYYFDDFNCRHFVYYCVYGKRECEAVKNISSVATPLLDILSTYLQNLAEIQPRPNIKTRILEMSDKVNVINTKIKKLK